jgi:hypothetical protein
MLVRKFILALAAIVGGTTHAAEIPALGSIEGLVVESLSTQYTLELDQVTLGACDVRSSDSITCAVENGSLRLGGTNARVLPITKVVYHVSRWAPDRVSVMYMYRAEWRQTIGGTTIDTPVFLTVNHQEGAPDVISGYVSSSDLNVSHQVVMKRTSR